MPIFSFFTRKAPPSKPVTRRLTKKSAVLPTPPFNVVGVASANSEGISSALAFVVHEVYGWKVATIDPRYFARKGVTAMLGLTSPLPDPVIGVGMEEATSAIENALESNFPGIWLRCLDYAASRLPSHILVVHGITSLEQAEWVRSRGGKVLGDGTVYGVQSDIAVGPDADNSYIASAAAIMDELTTQEQ